MIYLFFLVFRNFLPQLCLNDQIHFKPRQIVVSGSTTIGSFPLLISFLTTIISLIILRVLKEFFNFELEEWSWPEQIYYTLKV